MAKKTKEPILAGDQMPTLKECIMAAFNGQCAIQSSARTTEDVVQKSIELGQALHDALQTPE